MVFDTICLSGGGIQGFSFIGALDYLSSIGYIQINKITNWVGTSAGSMLSLLMCIGYTPREINDFVVHFDFKKLNFDISIDNIFNEFGVNNGKSFIFVISSFIKNKLNIDDLTFTELYNYTQKKLVVIGTNFSQCTEEVFSLETTPSMSIVTAIRISMSVPILFTPVLYNSAYYVDGGIKNNFPIKYCNKGTTLGIYIKTAHKITEISSVFTVLYGCVSIVNDTITLKDIDQYKYIIQINEFAGDFINFELDKEKKIKIINSGKIHAQKFIEGLPENIAKSLINQIVDQIVDQIK